MTTEEENLSIDEKLYLIMQDVAQIQQDVDYILLVMNEINEKISAPLPTPPEPPPILVRPTAGVRVKVLKCHLRFIDHLDGAGKAVWGSYPKRAENPKRDRYLAYLGRKAEVFTDGAFGRNPYRGAFPGTGGNHGWEVVPRQIFNKHVVPENVKLYILCKDVTKL